jgi:hypothetical protein
MIFDGTSMKGWTVSAKSRHSAGSDNKTGGHWEIKLTGRAHAPGRDPAPHATGDYR